MAAAWARLLELAVLLSALVLSTALVGRDLLQSKSANNLPLVQGSGSTAAAAVWRSIIANASATGNAPMSLTYDAVGSGQGQKNLFNRAYDYALSDVPIPTSVFNTLERKTLQLPFAISALDAVYSVSGLDQPLNLSASVLGGILQCTITRWDDPAIRAINPQARVLSADINPVVRVDSSGSTELLTNYLATDPSWQLGAGKSIAWPKCIKQVQGTDGILAYLGSQKNAIGYAEYGLAKGQPGVFLASMQNAAGHFVQPSEVINNYNVTEVFGDDFVVPTSLVSGAWANVSLSQSKQPKVFPISGLEYMNIEQNLTSKGYPQGLILKELAEYTLSHGVQKLLKSWYFGALPAKIVNIAKADLQNVIVMKRPSSADADNLPTHWINVYQPLPDANSSSVNRRR
ncbi:g10529 [Coccomyxa viridis]|uniref:G10529 protein n=1 Tax=Coccomyxa viridis TaxID=1274662 RepID=A0ABP1G5L4_9CHLO